MSRNLYYQILVESEFFVAWYCKYVTNYCFITIIIFLAITYYKNTGSVYVKFVEDNLTPSLFL